MSTYALTDETSIDTLIFWIESSDGSISYKEQEAVKRILSNMKYDMETFQKPCLRFLQWEQTRLNKWPMKLLTILTEVF